jgi:hypothetical protein
MPALLLWGFVLEIAISLTTEFHSLYLLYRYAFVYSTPLNKIIPSQVTSVLLPSKRL